MAKQQHTRVFSQKREFLGSLPNAVPTYNLKDAPLHKATFTLSVDDPGNEICQPFNLVEIYDNGERVELFRIIKVPEAIYTRNGGTITYECEHVLAELIDEVIPGYHEVGGWGGDGYKDFDTAGCLRYALGFQTNKNWVLKRCDFTRYFQYSWEDETVLRAILSIPNRLENEYMFTFDTTVYPWELSLVQLGSEPECELRYSRNLHEIRKTVDATQVVTRLIPRGYGEGINQLNIKEVNGGVEYLDADTQSIWGIRTRVWTDRRFEIAQSLKERAHVLLNEWKNPYVSYKVKAADIYRLTGEPFDKFYPGKVVRVIDHEHSLNFTARVTEISRADPRGKPGDITVTIAGKAKTVADTIAELASRASIQELYAQGATGLDSKGYADNADKDHPATVSVYVTQECVRINKAVLRWKLAAFRSYSRGAEAGGGSTYTSSSGGGSTQTSTSGGGGTETSNSGGGSTQTSTSAGETTKATDSGGATSVSAAQTVTNDSGVGFNTDASTLTVTETAHPSYSQSTGNASASTGSSSSSSTGSAGGEGAHTHSMLHSHDVYTHSHPIGTHRHYMSHTHSLWHQHKIPGHSHTIPAHTHSISIPSHTHNVTIPAHTHSITFDPHSHSVTIPAHTHSVEIRDHTHPLIAGIYDGQSVSAVTIRVDGVAVPASAITGNELDIVKYLSKDDSGRIRRNVWHDIDITPVPTSNNEDGLTRIVADLATQVFVRSQGGGDY